MSSSVILTCDQAIFTSVRGPMGEGYRIIAASKGLRPEEKQTITRSSPSHDSLCLAAGGSEDDIHLCGVAFYPLSTGRLCVAYSCFAGAEHTGRGGQRVYTLTLVFPAERLAVLRFNPFHVVRAIQDADLTQPELSPQPILPEVELQVAVDDQAIRGGTWCRGVAPPARKRLLQDLLEDTSLVVNLGADWIDAAEGLILGIPGPMRARISWAAGLRFSIGRGYRLHLLHDSTPATKSRTSGQRVEFTEPGSIQETTTRSAWVTLVERMWERGNLSGLSQRTSRPYRETAPEARERVARLFTFTDDLPKTETAIILNMVAEQLTPRGDEIERGIATEFVQAAGHELTRRFTSTPWNQVLPHWPALVELAKRSTNGAALACPVIEHAIRGLIRTDPLAAARASLPLAHFRPPLTPAAVHDLPKGDSSVSRPPLSSPPGLSSSPYLRRMLSTKASAVPPSAEAHSTLPRPAVPKTWDDLIDEVLTGVLQSLEYATNEKRSEIAAMIPPWRSARPTSPIVKQLADRAAGAVTAR